MRFSNTGQTSFTVYGLVAALALAQGCSSNERISNAVPTDELSMEVRVFRVDESFNVRVGIRDAIAGSPFGPSTSGGRFTQLGEGDEIVLVSGQRTIETTGPDGGNFVLDSNELPGAFRVELRRESGADALNTIVRVERLPEIFMPSVRSEIGVGDALDLSWGVVDAEGAVVDDIVAVNASLFTDSCAGEDARVDLFQNLEGSDSTYNSPQRVFLGELLPDVLGGRGGLCPAVIQIDFEPYDYGISVVYDPAFARLPEGTPTTGSAALGTVDTARRTILLR